MKLHFKALTVAIAAVVLVAAFEGCGGNKANSQFTTSEIAESLLSGSLNSTELNGTQASFYEAAPSKSGFALLQNLLSWEHASFAATACPTLANTTCASGNLLMTYSACTFPGSATVWSGSQNVFLSAGCPTNSASVTLAGFNAVTLLRTFGLNTTETTSAGIVTTIDTITAASSGWDKVNVTGLGEGISAHFTSTTGNRTISILGVHLRGIDTSSGNAVFDDTVSSNGIDVTGAGVSRTVNSGIITVQNNTSSYSAQVNITTPLAYSTAGCCHPASGVLTTQLSGSRDGIETLTFTGGSTGTCGSASFSDAARNKTDITLSHCF